MRTGLDAGGAGAPDVALPGAGAGGEADSLRWGAKYYVPEKAIVHRDYGSPCDDLRVGDSLEVGVQYPNNTVQVQHTRVIDGVRVDMGSLNLRTDDVAKLLLERRSSESLIGGRVGLLDFHGDRARELRDLPPRGEAAFLRQADTKALVAGLMRMACLPEFPTT